MINIDNYSEETLVEEKANSLRDLMIETDRKERTEIKRYLTRLNTRLAAIRQAGGVK